MRRHWFTAPRLPDDIPPQMRAAISLQTQRALRRSLRLWLMCATAVALASAGEWSIIWATRLLPQLLQLLASMVWLMLIGWLYSIGYNALNETNRRSVWLAYRLCPDCGYSLIGNTSGVCPECGGAIAEELATLGTSSASIDHH